MQSNESTCFIQQARMVDFRLTSLRTDGSDVGWRATQRRRYDSTDTARSWPLVVENALIVTTMWWMQMELLGLFYILHHSWFPPAGSLPCKRRRWAIMWNIPSASFMTGSLLLMSYSNIHSITNHRMMGRKFQLCWFGGYIMLFSGE